MVTKNCNSSVGTVVRQDLCWDVLISCEERNRRVKESVCIHENTQHASPALLPHDFASPHLALMIKFSQDTKSKPKSQESISICLKGCLPHLATQYTLKKTWTEKGQKRSVEESKTKGSQTLHFKITKQLPILQRKLKSTRNILLNVTWHPFSHSQTPTLKIPLDFPTHILRHLTYLQRTGEFSSDWALGKLAYGSWLCLLHLVFRRILPTILRGKMTVTSGEGCAILLFK